MAVNQVHDFHPGEEMWRLSQFVFDVASLHDRSFICIVPAARGGSKSGWTVHVAERGISSEADGIVAQVIDRCTWWTLQFGGNHFENVATVIIRVRWYWW